MAIVELREIAMARSGDKGDGTNIGVTARSHALYEFLADKLTAAVVKEQFKEICKGDITRHELPKLRSLNFLLENSLAGGGTETLIMDAQGKAHGPGLLHMKIDVPDNLLP